VETHKFRIAQEGELKDYFLAGGRLVNYKKIDLIVQAFNRLGLPLIVYGSGPEYKNLAKMAKSNIKFVGRVNDKELAKLYREAKAYIQPQVEDFGITAVESMASGRPVIAFNKGGSLETVKEGLSGTFFKDQDWASLAEVVLNFNSDDYNPEEIKHYAERFSLDIFKQQIEHFVRDKDKAHQTALDNQQMTMEI
jgi:glycosyltransferase involved in cell wall biosynthesis